MPNPTELASPDDVPAEIWLCAGNTLAGFVPSEGFNCTALRTQRGDTWLPVLSEPPSWEALRVRPSFYGSPLLAPYAYGVVDGTLTFEGQHYPLADGRERRAMHGFSRDHAWAVTDQTTSNGEASLSAHLTAGADDEASQARLAEFPFAIDMAVTYVLRPGLLVTRWEITNTGDKNLPLGAGIHPYFDLAPRSGRPDTGLTVGGHMRRLTDERFGHQRTGGYDDDPDRYSQRLDAILASMPEGSSMVDLFGRVEAPSNGVDESAMEPIWTLRDDTRQLSVALRASPPFRYIGNFVPHTHAVISPVLSTNRHGTHQRAAEGLDSGLITLAPGQVWRGWCSIEVTL